MSKLLIRTDTDALIGVGHVMRCLALAQAWQAVGSQTEFAMASEAPAVEAILATENCRVWPLSCQRGSEADAQQTITLAQQIDAEWVVVDGYQFGSNYQKTIKRAGLRQLFIDDYGHAGNYVADLVLNQNVSAHEQLYSNRAPDTRLLLGVRYALLRREFWSWRGWKREILPVANKVLVTMGGSDPENVTMLVIKALQKIKAQNNIEAVIVIGPNNQFQEVIKDQVKGYQHPIRLIQNATNMPDLMAWADIAISAGGSTCWELAFMGLPNLAIIIADNQRSVVEQIQARGITISLGWYKEATVAAIASALNLLLTNAKKRIQMSDCGQTIVDGYGTERVLMNMRGERMRLRSVRAEDCRLIWEWANDPETRAVSFNPMPIPWEQHVRWFNSRLNDPNCVYFLAVNDQEEAIGQVRYMLEKSEATISVGLAAPFRKQGYGCAIIRQASEKLLNGTKTEVIQAFIKPENEASIRAFIKAGYQIAGTSLVNGNPAVRFLLRKEDLI